MSEVSSLGVSCSVCFETDGRLREIAVARPDFHTLRRLPQCLLELRTALDFTCKFTRLDFATKTQPLKTTVPFEWSLSSPNRTRDACIKYAHTIDKICIHGSICTSLVSPASHGLQHPVAASPWVVVLVKARRLSDQPRIAASRRCGSAWCEQMQTSPCECC